MIADSKLYYNKFQMCFIWVARPLPEEEDMHLDEELYTGSSGKP